MARTQESLRITDAYRQRLGELSARAESLAVTEWQRLVALDGLDARHHAWVQRAAAALAAVQAAGVRLTGAYLIAYLRSELGHFVAAQALDATRYVGVSRTGKTLADALEPTVITVKQALAAGLTPQEALDGGQTRARRLVISEAMSTPRAALSDAIRVNEHIIGWRRVTAGGCGACLAASTITYGDSEPMLVHDNCQCTAEPVVAGAPDTHPRPDGHEIFAALGAAQQDALLGAEKAELVRSGQVALRELIAISPMVAIPDQITEAPLKALT